MDLCLAAERNLGLHLSRRWWEQPALDILGIRVRHAEEEGGGGIRGRGREREIRVGKNGGRGLICLGEPETI